MKVKRYSVNPFINNLTIKRSNKTIKINPILGKENNNNVVLLDRDTGEVKATHVCTYKQVDDTKFVKLFTQNIALTFDLKSPGIKAFGVLMFAIQKQALGTDVVALDKLILQDFLKENPSLKLSSSTFTRGLSELVDAKIIARHTRQGFFFINPSFVFNGNRLIFSNIIERKNKNEIENEINEIENQQISIL